MPTNKPLTIGHWAILLVLAAAGGIALLQVTPHGLGISTDSVAYIGAARNQAAGLGLVRLWGGGEVKPMTHFPPLYPLILSGLQLMGLPVLSGARVLSATAFAASGFLVGVLVLRITQTPVPAMVGTAVFMASPHMLEIHTWAMTESLFIFLGLAAMLLLAAYGQSHTWLSLLAAALAVSAACLTRYVGLSLLVAATVYVALQPGPGRRRISELGALLAVGLTPIAIWMIRNLRLSGSATNRALEFHLPPADNWREALIVLWEWAVPYRFPAWGAPALLVMLGLLVCVLVVQARPWAFRQAYCRLLTYLRHDARGPVLLYLVAYLAFLGGSLLFFDATTPLNQRLASPVLSLVIVLAASALPSVWRALPGRPFLPAVLALAVAAFLLSSWNRSSWLAQEIRGDARGLASVNWVESGLATTLASMPPNILLYTDNPEVVYAISGRGAYGFPSKFDTVTMRQRPDYLASLAVLRERLRNQGGAAIIFSPGDDPLERSIIEDVTQGLLLVYSGGEAQIFVTPGLQP